jgi:hypothetical protein
MVIFLELNIGDYSLNGLKKSSIYIMMISLSCFKFGVFVKRYRLLLNIIFLNKIIVGLYYFVIKIL